MAIISFENDINILMDEWLEWKEKIVKMAKVESKTRPLVKKLVLEFDSSGSEGKLILL